MPRPPQAHLNGHRCLSPFAGGVLEMGCASLCAKMLSASRPWGPADALGRVTPVDAFEGPLAVDARRDA
eukprot:m.135688 g.135688  ORF g.135688 m.135688 type:complete len:69 (-) comp16957_c1_seq1:496-702(-)